MIDGNKWAGQETLPQLSPSFPNPSSSPWEGRRRGTSLRGGLQQLRGLSFGASLPSNSLTLVSDPPEGRVNVSTISAHNKLGWPKKAPTLTRKVGANVKDQSRRSADTWSSWSPSVESPSFARCRSWKSRRQPKRLQPSQVPSTSRR